jgi:hypothetical protein
LFVDGSATAKIDNRKIKSVRLFKIGNGVVIRRTRASSPPDFSGRDFHVTGALLFTAASGAALFFTAAAGRRTRRRIRAADDKERR